MNIEHLRFPVGRFSLPKDVTNKDRQSWIDTIEKLPENLTVKISELGEHKLDIPYRPNGWTSRQVIHHLADSHMNSIIRFKWSLTEDSPKIKTYNEQAWSTLTDYDLPIESSMQILKGVHHRWTKLLRGMKEEGFQKSFFHPEHNYEYSLDVALALYDWHCRHHLGHIDLVINA